MNRLKLITFILRICLAIVVLTTASISIYTDTSSRYIYYSMTEVWVAIFCLAILNIIDLSEKEIKDD